MSFEADWLDLRAPADAAARDPDLLAAAVAVLAERPLAVDLGAGTGATVRSFAASPGLHWRLIDNDPRLLAIAGARHGNATPVRADLSAVADLPLAGAGLVTASALLDLMPGWWMTALADRLAALGIGIYAALSYDGAMAWDPSLPADRAITAAFNRHQQSDKGLGPALGPEAAGRLAAELRARGYRVRTAPSPWRLDARRSDLQKALVSGIADAASEAGLDGTADWAQARRAASGSTVCSVGHIDLLALPGSASAQSNTTSDSRP